MNYKEVRLTKKRFTTRYLSTLGIQAYGVDNLYPQDMSSLLDASGTGGVCFERYATFLEGSGFSDIETADFILNSAGETCGDLLRLIANDIARYHGFALHVNYNGLGDIVSVHQVPFECCRLEEERMDGTVPRIFYHPDWSGRKTRNGRSFQVTEENIQKYYQFNPIREVVLFQIAQSGGIENYNGQIFWVSLSGKNRYPTTIYDKIATELSTDEGLQNVKYRNVRSNFLPAGMLIRRRNTVISVDGDGKEKEDLKKTEEVMQKNAAALKYFLGDQNAGAIMEVYLQDGESAPEWQNIETENFDKKFDSTTLDTTQRIYAAFSQEPWFSLRVAKNGFSGDVLADAYDYYNSFLAPRREVISRAFVKIFAHWIDKKYRGLNFDIAPLEMIRQKWANLNQPIN